MIQAIKQNATYNIYSEEKLLKMWESVVVKRKRFNYSSLQ